MEWAKGLTGRGRIAGQDEKIGRRRGGQGFDGDAPVDERASHGPGHEVAGNDFAAEDNEILPVVEM